MIDHSDIVQEVWLAAPPPKTLDGAFTFLLSVIAVLQQRFPSEKVGLLRKTAGENFVPYLDSSVSASRLTYPDTNEMYKILTDVPGTNGWSWQPDSPIPTGGYYGEGYVAVEAQEVPVVPQFDFEAAFSALNAKLDALSVKVDADTEKVQQQIDQVVKNAEHSVGPILLLLQAYLASPKP